MVTRSVSNHTKIKICKLHRKETLHDLKLGSLKKRSFEKSCQLYLSHFSNKQSTHFHKQKQIKIYIIITDKQSKHSQRLTIKQIHRQITHTNLQTHKFTDKQTQIQTNKYRQTNKQIHRQTNKQIYRETNIHTDNQINIHTNKHKYRQSNKQIHRQKINKFT